MYRTKQEDIKNLAQQYEERVKEKIDKKNMKLRQQAEANLPKIVKNALFRINKAAKKGEYYIDLYRYNPWYRIWDTNGGFYTHRDNNHWNVYSLELLKSKLEEIGFRCDKRSEFRLMISWNHTNN